MTFEWTYTIYRDSADQDGTKPWRIINLHGDPPVGAPAPGASAATGGSMLSWAVQNLGQGRRILVVDEVEGPKTSPTMTLADGVALSVDGLHGFTLVGVFGSATGNPRGAPYVQGNVAGGLIQITNTDAYHLEGFLLRNEASGGHGVVIQSSAKGVRPSGSRPGSPLRSSRRRISDPQRHGRAACDTSVRCRRMHERNTPHLRADERPAAGRVRGEWTV